MPTTPLHDGIAISFRYAGKSYNGILYPIFNNIYQLFINGKYRGSLHYEDGWVFVGERFEEMADYFGYNLMLQMSTNTKF